ncbi:MAG: aspartate--tRNA ligase [Candidatus Nealsonbacteria bacterium]|nr:aspartate--tRNA ligase [Candidatus Nealsonbacteria bacterium]
MKRILNKETINFIGERVKLAGWVQTIRSHGKIVFLDLRDKSGILQIVITPENKSLSKIGKQLKPEWVISVIGEIKKRPKKMINLETETGKVELEPYQIEILSRAKTLPFPIDSPGYEIGEETRLRYRYLDLRRERMRKNLEIRQKVIHFMREFLIKEGFIEVETPILTKSTPEGARDFLVPARLQPGKFYALPQSPQQYKQLLMLAGLEKYFQVARCFRDEDPRADRQAEHTQLDIEMSFIKQEDILDLIERLYTNLVKKIFPEKKITKIPFPRITYKEAMEKYKIEKPDLRKNKSNPDELAFCFITDFPMFEWHKEEKRWGAMHHPFTLPNFGKQNLGGQAKTLNESIKKMKKNPEKTLGCQYDFVLNGYEIGGGSLRTTNLDILLAVFEVLGHKEKEVKKQFHHYFEAFSYGVPPHGGIAPGIDRFLAVILNEPNIREVMAFPKTGDNRDLMMNLPAEVAPEQFQELRLKIIKKK